MLPGSGQTAQGEDPCRHHQGHQGVCPGAGGSNSDRDPGSQAQGRVDQGPQTPHTSGGPPPGLQPVSGHSDGRLRFVWTTPSSLRLAFTLPVTRGKGKGCSETQTYTTAGRVRAGVPLRAGCHPVQTVCCSNLPVPGSLRAPLTSEACPTRWHHCPHCRAGERDTEVRSRAEQRQNSRPARLALRLALWAQRTPPWPGGPRLSVGCLGLDPQLCHRAGAPSGRT